MRFQVISVLSLLSFATVSSGQACDQWQETFPTARTGQTMALDSHRRVIVLFGGRDGQLDNTTWEWQDNAWQLRTTPVAPPPRRRARMAYDSARRVTVLFGGLGDAGELGDTWEWDGDTWEQVAATGPAPRYDHVMAYDPGSDTTVLYGGSVNGGTAGDTWEWDGNAWALRWSTGGPDHVTGSSMVYDPIRDRIILHGGWSNSPQHTTWEWDGNNWTLLSDTGPDRSSHTMAFDPLGGHILLFGGFDGDTYQNSNELWSFDGTTWTMVDDGANAPQAVGGATAAYDIARVQLLVFSGPTGQTWTRGFGGWQLVSDPRPIARSSPAVAFDKNLGESLMFGGYAGAQGAVDDTWSWDGNRWLQRAQGGPDPSQLADMVFDTQRSVVLLFDPTDHGPETWSWDGATWSPVSQSGPATNQFRMAYDQQRGRAVLFGGWSYQTPNAETWEWDGLAWTLVATEGPNPRFLHAMTYDDARGVTVLYGGTAGAGAFGDTWTWDGHTWTLAAEGGQARAGHSMVYDSDRQVVRLFGGTVNGAYNNETWEWDGKAWTFTGAGPIDSRWGHGMTYDPVLHRTFVWGGSDGAYLQDTWVLGPQLRFVITPKDRSATLASAATLSAVADGELPIQFQWLRNGQPLADGDNIAGAEAATLSIDPVAQQDFGTYRLLLANDCGSTISNPVRLNCTGFGCSGDTDDDGDVDLLDHQLMQSCLTGPGGEVEGACAGADVDDDLDGDLMDYQHLQNAFLVE